MSAEPNPTMSQPTSSRFNVGDRVRITNVDLGGLCWGIGSGTSCRCSAHRARRSVGKTGVVHSAKTTDDLTEYRIRIDGQKTTVGPFFSDEIEVAK